MIISTHYRDVYRQRTLFGKHWHSPVGISLEKCTHIYTITFADLLPLN